MRGLPLLIILALVFLPSSSAKGYQWYNVAVDTVDHPVYEMQFGGERAYVGTEIGVFRGYGLAGPWEGMGLEYPGLGAYSILYRQGAGWAKQTINEILLPGATGADTGDLDQDGDQDIVVAAYPPGDRIVWYENPLLGPGTRLWPAHDVGVPAMGAREVDVSDVDSDLDLDIAAALRDEDRIVWYESIPDTFADMVWIRQDVGDSLAGPRGVFVADINEDEHPDIVAGGMDAHTVVWIEAPGPAGLEWVTHYVDLDLAGVKGVFACDVDLDGDLDIVAAGRDAGDVVWYEQVGVEPEIWIKHWIDDDLPSAVSVWCGDLNRDRMPDVAVTARDIHSVVVYTQLPFPRQGWQKWIIDDALSGACALSAGDFDGDGRTDLVATGKMAGVVAWYKAPSEGMGGWQKFVIDASAGESMGVTTGDLDNDGDLDVVATNVGGEVSWYENDLSDVFCAFSDGTGTCMSDGIYAWNEIRQEWMPAWWCPRPYFIEAHPRLADYYFCGSHEGLFSSTDMFHWFEMGEWILPDTVGCIWFHPWDDNVLVVGTIRGLYRTVDGGMHWEQVGDVPEQRVVDLETASLHGPPAPVPMVFLSEGIGNYTDGIYRSDDLGGSWLRLNTIMLPTDFLQDYTADGGQVFMFLGTEIDGIYRLRADGTITGTLNTGLPNLTIHFMCYDPFIDTPAIYACTEGGLYLCLLMELTPVPAERPSSLVLSAAWPNPWREGVAFSLSGVPEGQAACLRVFDPAGRQVWSSGPVPSRGQMWSVYWDGASDGGDQVPPGVYFYRVRVSERAYSGKIVRVR